MICGAIKTVIITRDNLINNNIFLSSCQCFKNTSKKRSEEPQQLNVKEKKTFKKRTLFSKRISGVRCTVVRRRGDASQCRQHWQLSIRSKMAAGRFCCYKRGSLSPSNLTQGSHEIRKCFCTTDCLVTSLIGSSVHLKCHTVVIDFINTS